MSVLRHRAVGSHSQQDRRSRLRCRNRRRGRRGPQRFSVRRPGCHTPAMHQRTRGTGASSTCAGARCSTTCDGIGPPRESRDDQPNRRLDRFVGTDGPRVLSDFVERFGEPNEPRSVVTTTTTLKNHSSSSLCCDASRCWLTFGKAGWRVEHGQKLALSSEAGPP